MANGSGRRRGQPVARSHEDIYDAIERVERKADDALAIAKKGEQDFGLHAMALQRIEIAVKGVADDVGHMKLTFGEEGPPAADGSRDGSGMVGFVLRLDSRITRRFGIYDGWTRTVLGGAIVAGVLIPAFWAVLWWLTQDRVASVLRPHP